MRHRPAIKAAVRSWYETDGPASMRLKASLWPVVHASLAAALAWLVAHRVLGHSQPFFAPISAAVALSASHTRRGRRSIQMVIGALLGLGVAEILVALLGSSTIVVGVVVLVTMLVAVLLGAGFFGEGMMFVNQAAASAILVVTVRRHGIGAERALDVLVGGAIALIVGVLLFPASPQRILRAAEGALLRSLAQALGRASELLHTGARVGQDWPLATGSEIHAKIADLAIARASARANVRIAPRRWALRELVDKEDMRLARLDLLANAVLSLVRAITGALDEGESLIPTVREQFASFANAVAELADTPQPWPPQLEQKVVNLAQEIVDQAALHNVERTPVILSILRAGARDLVELVKVDHG